MAPTDGCNQLARHLSPISVALALGAAILLPTIVFPFMQAPCWYGCPADPRSWRWRPDNERGRSEEIATGRYHCLTGTRPTSGHVRRAWFHQCPLMTVPYSLTRDLW